MGFDVDLAQAISAAMGYEHRFDQMPFNTLLLRLRSKKADLAVSAITPTNERQTVVNFSSVYYEAQSVVVTQKGSEFSSLNHILSLNDISSLVDIAGSQIGVKPGTLHEQWAKRIPTADIVAIDNAADGLQALKSGLLDAVIIDRAIAELYLDQMPTLETTILENEDPAGAAVAFPNDSPLLRSVNRILAQLKADGTIDELILKWFDTFVCPSQEQSA